MAASETDPAVKYSVQRWLHRHRKAGTEDDNEVAHSSKELSPEDGFVNLLQQACVKRLCLLNGTLRAKSWSSKKSRREMKEIETKFRLFGETFEHGKLESCLGDEEIGEKILRLLFGIATALTQNITVSVTGKDILRGSEHYDSMESLEAILAHAKPTFDISDTEGESTGSEDSDSRTFGADSQDAKTFYRRCLCPLRHYVGLLMEMCPTLEAIYRFKHRVGIKRPPDQPVTVSMAARPYVSNVQDKFPLATQEIVNRLGEANWQRHVRLRTLSLADAQTVTSEAPKSVFQPVTLFKDSALGSSLRKKSEIAASVTSNSSFLSSNEGDKSRPRVPKMPTGSDWGNPFPCPFCHKVIDIHTRVAWKLHVYSDLQAYVCTSKDCPEMLTLFTTRKAWAKHEMDHHLSYYVYRCPCHENLIESKEKFLDHMKDCHKTPESLESTILAKAQVTVRYQMGDIECQLCSRRGFTGDRDYATHVGKHLEEIALIALPPTSDSDDENSSGGDSGEEDHGDGNGGPPFGSRGDDWFDPNDKISNPDAPQKAFTTAPSPKSDNPANSLDKSSLRDPSIKKHKCPYCSSEFSKHHNLKSHLLTHSHVKTFECQQCQQRFRRFHDLRRHTKIHTSERLYVCVKCGRNFSGEDALGRHQKFGGCANLMAGVGSFREEGDHKGGGSEDHNPEYDDYGLRSKTGQPVILAMPVAQQGQQLPSQQTRLSSARPYSPPPPRALQPNTLTRLDTTEVKQQASQQPLHPRQQTQTLQQDHQAQTYPSSISSHVYVPPKYKQQSDGNQPFAQLASQSSTGQAKECDDLADDLSASRDTSTSVNIPNGLKEIIDQIKFVQHDPDDQDSEFYYETGIEISEDEFSNKQDHGSTREDKDLTEYLSASRDTGKSLENSDVNLRTTQQATSSVKEDDPKGPDIVYLRHENNTIS